ILGLGRAAGETMAVTLIIGNSPKIFTSLFDQGATMASIIANNFAESGGLFLSSLIEIGLILFAVTFLINVGRLPLPGGLQPAGFPGRRLSRLDPGGYDSGFTMGPLVLPLCGSAVRW